MSVLAVAETLICVAVYWALVLWFGVTWHHWLIVIATPLVLLRSEQSIAKGVEWFRAYWNIVDDNKPNLFKWAAILVLSIVLACGAAWILATNWLAAESNWGLFWKGMLIGWLSLNIGLAVAVAVAGTVGAAVAGAVAVAGTVAVAVAGVVAVAGAAAVAVAFLGPGIIAGKLFRATIARFAATARYLWPGLRQLPANWRFSMLVSDVYHNPELIPGDPKYAYGGNYSFSFKKVDGTPKEPFDLIFYWLASIIFYTPTMLWRWSIKSTAWFYIPLLWVRRGWVSLEGEDLRIWAQSYSRKVLNWVWLIFGGLSFAALAVGLFSFEKWLALKNTTSEAGAPMGLLGFLASLNWAELLTKPWLWFYFPSYALTIYLFFALDSIAADIRAGAAPESRLPHIARLTWVANARAVCTNIGLALALWYFLDAVDAFGQVRAVFDRGV